jgi:hypothetical protein
MCARAFFPNFGLRRTACGQCRRQILLVEEIPRRGHVAKEIGHYSVNAAPQLRGRSKLSLKLALEFSQVRPRLDDGHNIGRVGLGFLSIMPRFCGPRMLW